MSENQDARSDELYFWSWGHQLRGEVGTIRNLVFLAKSELELPAPDLKRVAAALEKIEQASAALAQNPSPFQVEPVYIDQLLVDDLRRLRERCPQINIRFSLNRAVDLVVSANPVWLRRLFDILCDNAVEAMEASPERVLDISSSAKQRQVWIRFRDTGKGIAPQELTGLFQKPAFLRQKGRGRGLYIAHLIVDAYGGSMDVEAAGPEGTTFLVRLPLSESGG
jgi:signal transduction histidine kinase